ncbi:flagellar biosynthesis regulator FlaF [Oceaniglobus roseus]|uniref:flagellar biosynthesis regulator FlaF n=1 Tax=Oceaniglobus roseus TaxID=1737570 RepID=UPI000C7F5298|nr:flagellar biosynthesis regulator FlaF [Kandeliimicrobium roseum]
MNALQLAKTAYSPVAAPLRTAQCTEYEAFVKVTTALRSARNPAEMARAVYENRRLWGLLAADVAGDGNRLPGALRARIFYLSEFTSHHSRKVLAGDATADVLVDINSAVMAGLRQQRSAG